MKEVKEKLVPFADASTEYFFDMYVELQHLHKETYKAIVLKDRTGHYRRYQEILNPGWENFLKPVFDDLQAGRSMPPQESGGKPVEEPKPTIKGKKATKIIKDEAIAGIEVREDETGEVSMQPIIEEKKKERTDVTKEGVEFVIPDGALKGRIIHKRTEILEYIPERPSLKRAALMGMMNKKRHPLRKRLGEEGLSSAGRDRS